MVSDVPFRNSLLKKRPASEENLTRDANKPPLTVPKSKLFIALAGRSESGFFRFI
jgi:hypothetical protein